MSFEQALKELEVIVRKLEAGHGELESSIADYTRGTALKEHCQKRLAGAGPLAPVEQQIIPARELMQMGRSHAAGIRGIG